MWYWQVLYQDIEGNLHELFSTIGFKTQWEAQLNWEAHSKSINEALQKHKAVLVIDETIVWRREE